MRRTWTGTWTWPSTSWPRPSHNEAAPPIIRTLALSCLSLAEAECGHQVLSRGLAEDAMQVVDSVGLQGTPQASLAFTALGLAQAEAGEMTAAVATIEQGLVLRRKNPAQGPWGALHHVLAGARVAMRGRRARGGEAAGRGGVGPDGCLSRGDGAHAGETASDRGRDLRVDPAATTTEPLGHEVLTDRELEVLRLLQGSLSLSEIAGELYISPNTVKTHAKAVYRKLGVSSRTEAVRIARGSQLV